MPSGTSKTVFIKNIIPLVAFMLDFTAFAWLKNNPFCNKHHKYQKALAYKCGLIVALSYVFTGKGHVFGKKESVHAYGVKKRADPMRQFI